jgi:RNA polymerase sigma-70 factor, ECF subfamily
MMGYMTSLSCAFVPSHRVAGVIVRSAAASLEATHDAELVRRFNGGDDAAFVEIVTRYRGRMFAIGLSLLRNRADAEEIAQETFVRAHRGLPLFRGDSSLSSWLNCIATNLSRNRYWYFHRRRQHQTCSLDGAFSDGSEATFADLVASAVPDPAREATNREFIEHVTLCMGKLNSNQREILRLRNLMDCSYEDIARRLGITVGTVKSRIARARNILRGLLGGMYGLRGPDASLSAQCFEPNRSAGGLIAARN